MNFNTYLYDIKDYTAGEKTCIVTKVNIVLMVKYALYIASYFLN